MVKKERYVSKLSYKNNLNNIYKYMKIFLGELIGTFIFLSVIIYCVSLTPNDNLMTSIAIFGSITGGHFNPAVSFMFYLNNKLSIENLVIYIVAQLIGASMALILFKLIGQ